MPATWVTPLITVSSWTYPLLVSSPRAALPRALFSLLVTILALGQLSVVQLAGAPTAAADSVWFQSYERSSASEVCQAQPDDVPWQASWGPYASWEPSWEQ